MSDVMLFGILRMPYDMAMSDELSRMQFHSSAQEAISRLERADDLLREIDSHGVLSPGLIARITYHLSENSHSRSVIDWNAPSAGTRDHPLNACNGE